MRQSSSSRSQGAHAKKLDPLLNPLRAVLRRFSCKPCGYFDPNSGDFVADGSFRCRSCLSGECLMANRNFAYVSLMYGNSPQYVFGAVALGHSLQASGSPYPRLMLHTSDVPGEARELLQGLWTLKEVDYIVSAPDLHTQPYEKAKFKEVFTKLQVLNPAVVPFDRVVFLDLDTLVMKNIDELFELRPPAGMYNMKGKAELQNGPSHGTRMDPQSTYFNAGTMVLAPSQTLFELLAQDVQAPDAQWHSGAWSPEQSYLSKVLAGDGQP